MAEGGFFNILVNLFYAAVLAATPLLFGTLGEILTQKSGNINLGVEGMMYMGAIASIAAAWMYENAAGASASPVVSMLLAVVCGFLAGVLGGLIYSLLTVTLRANQNVTGLTLTIFGAGVGNFFGELLGIKAQGFATVMESTKSIFQGGSSTIPVLGKLLLNYSFMVYLAIILAVLMAVFFNRSRIGLNLRAVGESPATADAAGINVARYKYLATCIGGGLCGLGGVTITMMSNNGSWVHNCVGGQGWIAVALVIFAAWKPSRALWGALLFGALSVLRFYFVFENVPAQVFNAIPYVATVLVLIFTSIRQSRENSQPKSCGTNYFREER